MRSVRVARVALNARLRYPASIVTEYPRRLDHKTPAWVSDLAIFHIRIRCEPDSVRLVDPAIAPRILQSAQSYVATGRWSCHLMILMPDHLHALLSFGRTAGMGTTIRNWKRGQSRLLGVRWQENYFDHRIRGEAEYSETFAYLERNPVASGLCEKPEDWPWRTTGLAPDAVPRF